MENKPTVKLKTYTYYIKNKNNKSILNWMTDISKNIYNTTIFIYKIYQIYQNEIYKDVYEYIIKNNLHTYFLFYLKKIKQKRKIKMKIKKKLKKNIQI